MIEVGFEYAQSAWVVVVFDTRPDAAPDGEWNAHIEGNELERPSWLEAGEANMEGPITLVRLDGKEVKLRKNTELAKPLGELVKAVLLKARADGVFDGLPKADGCELGVEHTRGLTAGRSMRTAGRRTSSYLAPATARRRRRVAKGVRRSKLPGITNAGGTHLLGEVKLPPAFMVKRFGKHNGGDRRAMSGVWISSARPARSSPCTRFIARPSCTDAVAVPGRSPSSGGCGSRCRYTSAGTATRTGIGPASGSWPSTGVRQVPEGRRLMEHRGGPAGRGGPPGRRGSRSGRNKSAERGAGRFNSPRRSRPAAGIEAVAALDQLVAGLDLGVDPGHVLDGPAVRPDEIDPVAGALVRAGVGPLGDLQDVGLHGGGIEVPVAFVLARLGPSSASARVVPEPSRGS